MLEHPEQLRSSQPADEAGNGRIKASLRQPRAPQFAPKKPQADEGACSDQDAKARDLELTDAEENRKDGLLLAPRAWLYL